MSEQKFGIVLEKQLELFRTAAEWSDLVAYLTGLEGILRINKYTCIPKPHLLYRRLNQCLNPALPAGVHMKALGVYKIVISKITRENLLKEIDILTLGLFSFYSHSNLTSIPNYLDVLKQLIDALGEKSIKICKNIILGIIMGLEEESSEQYGMAIDLLTMLEKKVGSEIILQNTWEVMGQCTELVPGCLVYVGKAEKGLKIMHGKENLLRMGFVSALKSKETITLRRSFDLLLNYVTEQPQVELCDDDVSIAILRLLLMKEISLVKRVQTWISLMVKRDYGTTQIFTSLCKVFYTEPAVYFKILMAIRQNIEEASEIIKRSILWTLSIMNNDNEVYAMPFLKVLDKRLLWTVFTKSVVERALVNKAIKYRLMDEESQTKDLPLIIKKCIEIRIYPYEWIDSIKPTEDSYRMLFDSITENKDLSLITFLLSIPLTDDLLNIYKISVKNILKIIVDYWAEPGLTSTTHFRILKALKKISVPLEFSREDYNLLYISILENSEVFWAYDKILKKKLQNILMDKILHTENGIRQVLDGAKELEIAFNLANTYNNLELNDKFMCFLISFCDSHNYSVRKKAQLFCSKIKRYSEVVKSVFDHLNNPIEREIKEKVFIRECDYNRILFGLQILDNMLLYSTGFKYYINNEEDPLNQLQIQEVSDIVEYYTATTNSSLLVRILSLLLMYSTGEYPEVQSENKYVEEITEISKKIIRVLLIEEHIYVSVTVREDVLKTLLLRSKTQSSIEDALKIVATFGLDEQVDSIAEIYRNMPSIRDSLISYCIANKNSSLLLVLFRNMCILLGRGVSAELYRIEYVLQHSLGVSGVQRICDQEITQSRQNDAGGSGQLLCSCGLLRSSLPTDSVIFTAISFLLDLFIALRESPQIEDNNTEPLLTIKKYFVCIHQKYPQILAEGLIYKYSKKNEIDFVRAIDKEIEKDVFLSVIKILSSEISSKYKLLRGWLQQKAKDSSFESPQIFGAVFTIITQAKIKGKQTELLWFLAEFTRTAKSSETLPLTTKILEVCVGFGVKLGSRKISEEKNDNYLELFEMLDIVKLVIESALEKNYPVDLYAVWNSLVFPCYKLSHEHSLFTKALETTKVLVRIRDNKHWKKDFYDYAFTDRFFKDSLVNLKCKIEIGSFLIDPDRISDLVNKAGSAAFFARESDILFRASVIKRLRFMILCAPFGEYEQNAPNIFSLISELFFVSNRSAILLKETFNLCSVLCIKMPGNTLINMWPISISEAIGALTVDINTPGEVAIAFAALQFLDLVATLDYPELIEFRWLVENLADTLGHPSETPKDNVLRTHRITSRVKISNYTKDELVAIIQHISKHHRNQKDCTKTDRQELESVVIEGLAEG